MKAHILGNGPSIEIYKPQDGFIIGCNFQEYPCDINVLLDCKPFLVYRGNRDLVPNKKVITSKYAWPTIEEQDLTNEFEFVYVLPFLEKYVSAGHVATQWALENNYTEIHLWGFDSIWQDTQETRTDKLVVRSRAQFDLYVHWREKWQPFKKHNIIVHNTIEGTQLKDLL